jgi:GNAT superfamily N-acetyltransferase
MNIRAAKVGDESAIHELIVELAVYERAQDEVTNTVEQLRIDLFEDRICDAIVVEEDSKVVGFALFYTSYSTWKGRCLYLEDFYVREENRRNGIGSQLFQKVVEIAKIRGVKRMDWQVLEWNEPGLNFYKKENAILDPEWVNGRLFF